MEYVIGNAQATTRELPKMFFIRPTPRSVAENRQGPFYRDEGRSIRLLLSEAFNGPRNSTEYNIIRTRREGSHGLCFARPLGFECVRSGRFGQNHAYGRNDLCMRNGRSSFEEGPENSHSSVALPSPT